MAKRGWKGLLGHSGKRMFPKVGIGMNLGKMAGIKKSDIFPENPLKDTKKKTRLTMRDF
jgi:hypothetical protein